MSKKNKLEHLFVSMIGNASPQFYFFKFLRLTLGYIYDKDVGIIEVSLSKNINFLKQHEEGITFLLQQFAEQDFLFLSFLFLLIICNDKNSKDKIGTFIFNKWVEASSILRFIPEKSVLEKSVLEIDNSIKKIRPLHYFEDSCYIDSSLVAMFILQHPIIDETILFHHTENENVTNLKNELASIALSLRGQDSKKVINVTNLRSIIKPLDPPQPFYEEGSQNEAGEFITWLFEIFKVDIATYYTYNYYGNDNKEFKQLNAPVIVPITPIVVISSTILKDLDQTKEHILTSFIKNKEITDLYDKKNKKDPTRYFYKQEGSTYRYRKQITKLVSPFYMFDVKRSGGSKRFYKTKLIPPEFMFIKNYNKLYLSSIIIHTGGAHYVCVFKYLDEKWYYYNDNPGGIPKIKKLGSYDNMLKNSPYNPCTNGTVYFYMPILE
jgi:hypothetical protein